MTADHLVVLHRLADELIINFDSDTAGADAAERAIDLAEANDFSVKIAIVQGFKDAADAAQADPENIRAERLRPRSQHPNFISKNTCPSDRATLATRDGLRNLRAVLMKLRSIASPVEREFWFKKLAELTGIALAALEEESKRTTENVSSAPATPPKKCRSARFPARS